MSQTTVSSSDARRVLECFPAIRHDSVARFGNGLINDTFAVDGPHGAYVLQRVHPIFAPEIHHNIVAVTEHLAACGMPTPVLVRASDGRPWVERSDGVWRLMTRMDGIGFDAAHDAGQIRAAAELLARFHGALESLEHTFVGMRAGVHDTSAHLHHLERMLNAHEDHRLHAEVAPLARAIFERAATLPQLDDLPHRIVHGDPKLNNVLFAGDEGARRAICWVDLDTVGPMPLHLELGDAWRSWCNVAGEDDADAAFDLNLFEASLEGYAASCSLHLQARERAALLHGVEWITLELCARFAADALAESYFGWDPGRYESAGAHNFVRARGQWALHEQVLALRTERAALVQRMLGPA